MKLHAIFESAEIAYNTPGLIVMKPNPASL